MRRWVSPNFAFSLAVACASAEASAQNLLKNARFDWDLSSWRSLEDKWSSPGLMAWSTLDANGSSTSGSLELRTSAVFGRESFSIGQCVAVIKPSEYAVFGGRIQVPSGQPVAGFADLRIQHFRSSDCSGFAAGQSGLGGIANASFWSSRTDFASVDGATSIRLVATITKRYEWQEGDQTGEVDDNVMFHAFFDDLFLQLTTEADLTKLVRSLRADHPQPRITNQTTALWGKNTVEVPALSVRAFGSNGRDLERRHAEFSSLEQIGVAVTLKTPYSFEDPQWYPLQDFSVASPRNQQNFGRRPTLEFFVSRVGDPAKRPIEIGIDSPGSGVVEGAPDASAYISLIGKSDYRARTLRRWYGCLKGALPRGERKREPEPTDNELLVMGQYFVANPPGDYELVARYFALEAGFWHEPVYSETLRIRIVKKDFNCGKPQRPDVQPPTSLR